MGKIRVYCHGCLGEAYEEAGIEVVDRIDDADVVVVMRGVELEGEVGEKVVVRQGEWSVWHTLGVARAMYEQRAAVEEGEISR